jgi:hypothetical protein
MTEGSLVQTRRSSAQNLVGTRLRRSPDDFKEKVTTVLNVYDDDLNHNALVITVQEKYPVHAKNSQLNKGSESGFGKRQE